MDQNKFKIKKKGMTLEQYNKKYRNRKDHIIKLSKKDVEQYDITHKAAGFKKNHLLKGRKWVLIGDTYYQVPKPLSFTWFRNLHAGVQIATCSVLGLGVASAVAVPLILNNRDNTQYFNVSFDSNGGTEVETQRIKKGEKAKKPEQISKANSVFVDWMYKGLPFNFDTPITEDVLLKADWTLELRTITFKYNDEALSEDNLYTTKSVSYGKHAVSPSDPTHPTSNKKMFDGWKISGTEDYFDFDEEIINDITLYASWSDCNNINFRGYQGGDVLITKQVSTTEKTSRPKDSEIINKLIGNGDYSDCSIVKWLKDDGQEFSFGVTIDNDVTIYPTWEINSEELKVIGNHNIDITTNTPLAVMTGTGPNETERTVDKSEYTKYQATIDNEIVDIESNDLIIKPKKDVFTGSANIKIQRTYKKPGGTEADDVIKYDNFEIELGSYSKLDKTSLKKGEAKAISKDIKGDVYIPKRYFDDETGKWITIKKIAKDGFKDCIGIDKVYISVPTIIIGENAFVDCGGGDIDFEFEDKSNTWAFEIDGKIVELDPNDDEEYKLLKNALKEGNSSEKAPTKYGLRFTPIKQEGVTISYSVEGYNGTPQGESVPKDLLIPQKVTVDDATGVASSTIEGLPVTEIKSSGFKNSTTLETLTIHSKNNLTAIGDNAFSGCSNLKGVYFSEVDKDANYASIKKIGSLSFYNCPKLTSIELPNTVTTISQAAFSMDQTGSAAVYSGLKEINLPESLVYGGGDGGLGTQVFKNCGNLIKATISSNNLSDLTSELFYNCLNLTQINIPFSVCNIKSNAFHGSGLVSVTFDDYASTWKSSSKSNDFEAGNNDYKHKKDNATNLITNSDDFSKETSDLSLFEIQPITETGGEEYKITSYKKKNENANVTVPSFYTFNDGKDYFSKPITQIDKEVFKGDTKIESISIPSTIKTIGSECFSNISNLNSINLPNNSEFKTIEDKLFYNSKRLTYIEIPTSVTTIKPDAFAVNSNDNAAQKIEKGIKRADFGAFMDLWECSEGSYYTFANTEDDNLQYNANLLKRLSNLTLKRTSEKVITGFTVSFLKSLLSTKESLKPEYICINLFTNKGHTETVSGDESRVIYQEAKIGGRQGISWTDVTKNILNGTFTGSDGETRYLNVKVKIDDNTTLSIYTPDNPRVLPVEFKAPTDESKFTFTDVKDSNDQVIGYAIHKGSSVTYGKNIVLPDTHTVNGVTKPVICVGNANNQTQSGDGFGGVTGVDSIVLPNSIKLIGVEAFVNSSFKYVEMSTNLKQIETNAFKGMTNYKFHRIPSSVKYIAANKLEGNTFNFEQVYFQNPEVTWKIGNEAIGYFDWKPSFESYAENAKMLKLFADTPFTSDINYDPLDDWYK